MAAGEPRAAQALPPGLAQLFEIVLDTAAGNRSLDAADLETFRLAGADAALQGLRLASVIDAYLRGAGELWEQVLAEPDDFGGRPMLERGRTLRRVSEDAVAALATGYEDAQRRTIRAQEAVRREFIDDLLSGAVDVGVLGERARRLDFPIAEAFVVAAARTVTSSAEAGGRSVTSAGTEVAHERAERLVRSRLGAPGRVVATHHGLLVVVVPSADVTHLDHLLPVVCSAEPVGWAVAIGRSHPGADGVARSFLDARETLELADRVGWPQPVVRWDELLPYRLVGSDPTIARELAERVIRPLLDAPRGSLLPTVEAHIDCGGNMAEMARVLALSPRAVAYRLERIKALTGRSLRDPEDRFVVELALRCHRLGGGGDLRW